MYLHNLTSEDLPVPEIIGGTPKNWGVPGYAHGPFFEIFKWAFARMDPVSVSAEFDVRGFTLFLR